VLRAQAGPTVVMRTASRARASWLTLTVTYPLVTVAEQTQSARRSVAASVIAIRWALAGWPPARRSAMGVAYVPGAGPLSGVAGCQVPAVVIARAVRLLISAASSRSRSPVSTVAG
jgi:hypothetical protein